MSSTRKTILIVLGALAGLMVASQLVLGQLILSGRADLVKAHQHTGYTAVAVALVYIVVSLAMLLSLPTRREP